MKKSYKSFFADEYAKNRLLNESQHLHYKTYKQPKKFVLLSWRFLKSHFLRIEL